MELFVDFLVNNYLWFLVITIILVLSLIGYFVDAKESRTVGDLETPVDMEKNFEELAKSAQNKSISEAVQKVNNIPLINNGVANNTIIEQPVMNTQPVYSQPNVVPQPQPQQQINMQQTQGVTMNQMTMPQQNQPVMNNNINMPQPVNTTVEQETPTFEVLGK